MPAAFYARRPLALTCCFASKKTPSGTGLKPLLFQVSTPEGAYDLRSDYGSPHCCNSVTLLRPCSARVLALLERRLRNEFTVFIVNSYLNFVEVFRVLLTACVGVRSGLFRDGYLVTCRLLRLAIEAVFYGIARIFELFDDRFILLVEARCYLDVLLRGLA